MTVQDLIDELMLVKDKSKGIRVVVNNIIPCFFI